MSTSQFLATREQIKYHTKLWRLAAEETLKCATALVEGLDVMLHHPDLPPLADESSKRLAGIIPTAQSYLARSQAFAKTCEMAAQPDANGANTGC